MEKQSKRAASTSCNDEQLRIYHFVPSVKTVLFYLSREDSHLFGLLVNKLRQQRSKETSFGALFTRVIKSRLDSVERITKLVIENPPHANNKVKKKLKLCFDSETELTSFESVCEKINRITTHFGCFIFEVLKDYFGDLQLPGFNNTTSTVAQTTMIIKPEIDERSTSEEQHLNETSDSPNDCAYLNLSEDDSNIGLQLTDDLVVDLAVNTHHRIAVPTNENVGELQGKLQQPTPVQKKCRVTRKLADGTLREYYYHRGPKGPSKCVSLCFSDQKDFQRFYSLTAKMRQIKPKKCSSGAFFTKVLKTKLGDAEKYIMQIEENTTVTAKMISKSVEFHFSNESEVAAFADLCVEINRKTIHFGYLALLFLEDFLGEDRDLPVCKFDNEYEDCIPSPLPDSVFDISSIAAERNAARSWNEEIGILEKKLKSALVTIKSLSTRLSKCTCGQRTWSDIDFEITSFSEEGNAVEMDPLCIDELPPKNSDGCRSLLSPIENLITPNKRLVSEKNDELIQFTQLATEEQRVDDGINNHVGTLPSCSSRGFSQRIEDDMTNSKENSGVRLYDGSDIAHEEEVMSGDQQKKIQQDGAGAMAGSVFECPVCSLTYSSSAYLVAHQKRHRAKVGKFKCDYPNCSFSADRNKNLAAHIRIHTGEKTFLCTICGKKFSSEQCLSIHNRRHSNDRQLQCSICGKGFVSDSGFRRHAMTHTDEKPYSCMTCGKSFNRASNMRVHQRTHTDDNPYSCRFCNSSFKQLTSLNWHEISSHQKPHPYSCSKCEKGFVVPSQLKAHKCPIEKKQLKK